MYQLQYVDFIMYTLHQLKIKDGIVLVGIFEDQYSEGKQLTLQVMENKEEISLMLKI